MTYIRLIFSVILRKELCLRGLRKEKYFKKTKKKQMNILPSFKRKIKPKRFYEELAEMGLLEDYLKYQQSEKYENDIQFRNEMLEILYQKSIIAVTDIEIIHLEKLCESLSYFLEYIKLWKNQRH